MLSINLMQKISRLSFVVLFSAALISALACGNVFGPSASDTPAQIEQHIFNLVNEHRRSIGVSEFAWNETIAEQARLHSLDMADGTVPFGHDGFDARVAKIAESLPWRSAAEVAALATTAAVVVNGWIASAEHKPMLEGDFEWTGVGVVMARSGSSFYATQIMIKRR
jgi:uncharacterized protein YkwD